MSNTCSISGYADACTSSGNSAAVGGAAGGAAVGRVAGGPGAVAGAVVGAMGGYIGGCATGCYDYHQQCSNSDYNNSRENSLGGGNSEPPSGR